jgi:hypothetical protein
MPAVVVCFVRERHVLQNIVITKKTSGRVRSVAELLINHLEKISHAKFKISEGNNTCGITEGSVFDFNTIIQKEDLKSRYIAHHEG